MGKLNSLLMDEKESPLFLDYYEFTSGKSNFDHKRNNKITEIYYFRKIPENMGNYMIAAGLEQVMQFIYNFRLSDDDAEWLKSSSNGGISDEFIDYLKNFKFNGT
jgi:Nicotinic acid phosphoribosyltransferase